MEYASAAAFSSLSGREPSFVWFPHVLSIPLALSPSVYVCVCLTSLCINQSPSPLRPLGDSNDTALSPSGGWGWDEV